MAKHGASKKVKALAVSVPVATAGVTMLTAQPAAAGARGSVTDSFTFTTTSQQQVTCTVTVTTENANYNNLPNVAFASYDIEPNVPACTAIVPPTNKPDPWVCAYWQPPAGEDSSAELCEFFPTEQGQQYPYIERLYAPVKTNGYFEVFFSARFPNCASGECEFTMSHLARTK
jgi:hypothetical protein